MRIAILDYEHAVSSAVAGPADIFASMMRTGPMLTGGPIAVRFDIDFVSEKDGQLHRRDMQTAVSSKVGRQETYDLVIVPAMHSDKIVQVIEREQRLVDWLRQQHQQGAELASICVGAFLLGATGLLNGKVATTHWLFADRFRDMYPEVEIQDDKIIVDQGSIYTCGGAFSFTTFIMYLLEKFCGHEAAIIASKILMINVHQQPQDAFSIFRLQHNHADDMIIKAQQYIEKKYADTISIEALAVRYNMSIRHFIRRFEQATGNTPLAYLQRVRIEAAKKMLENSQEGVEQIAFRCGYEDMSFFRKIFKRYVAMTPKAYKEKYGRNRLQMVTASMAS
ncbi:GlxA family transcriptional regulator [Chitinophaga qingshengii]|uniref:Helix-turn-helix domain-containing protein n=1 Tax=Chitinophaga qingshengii TaxID=1569794 RepID=A0ABR7TMA4_9BACT|nr:helix-turn-helix domain-containing protein [Chitinophaga qingshengii]MBC9930627.1 helix-turn-helix domain-containing protein [Chitinophaga qingshengii]